MCDSAKTYLRLVFYYSSASEEFCPRNCQKASIPLKAQTTQLATFLTRKQNRLPSSTKNSFSVRRNGTATQLNPYRDKIFSFTKNKFFQQSQYSTSSRIFAFGKSVEAAKPSEMEHWKVLCFNPHCLFGADGTAEHPNDYDRAASLERRTQLAFENDMLHLRRQQFNIWKAHLVRMGNNEQQFCRNSRISLKRLY